MSEQNRDRRATLGSLGSLAFATAGLAAMSGRASAAEPGKSLAQRLDWLESHQQIEDVLYRYARGWDRYDEEALRSCFWPDSMHEHGGFKGKSQDFISKAWPYIGTITLTTHAITNVQILIDGDRAMSECYFAAHHQRPNSMHTGDEDYFVWGRYVDRHLRRNGEWKIIYRHGLSETEQVMTRDPHIVATPADQLSRRKPDDPLYQVMADFKAGR